MVVNDSGEWWQLVGAASLYPMRSPPVRDFESVPRQTRQMNTVKIECEERAYGGL